MYETHTYPRRGGKFTIVDFRNNINVYLNGNKWKYATRTTAVNRRELYNETTRMFKTFGKYVCGLRVKEFLMNSQQVMFRF